MNRQIKFKVWDVIGKRMIPFEEVMSTGVDISTPDGRNYQMPLFSVAFVDGEHKVIALQYVGIKDKNGKEIYENDIIRLIDGSIGIVKYDEQLAAYIFVGKLKSQRENIDWESTSLSYTRPRESEIIGNTFETPNLVIESEFIETPTNIVKDAHEDYLK